MNSWIYHGLRENHAYILSTIPQHKKKQNKTCMILQEDNLTHKLQYSKIG